MSKCYPSNDGISSRSRFSYGWVIVASCTLVIAIAFGLLYSYSVFFKPVAAHFDWDRATASSVYSVLLITRGVVSIGVGWLADRYGSRKLTVFCGFMVGLGLVLSSQVRTLGQFFLTYAVMEGIGFSGAYGIGAALISRWFTKNRGLPLGILAAGSGLGTLVLVPVAERLIAAFDWSQAFVICGAASGVIVIGAALLLRSPAASQPAVMGEPGSPSGAVSVQQSGATAGQAARDPRMIVLMGAVFFFFFGTQMVMVHLVNYATDQSITPLVAATFVSVIGAVSIAGRLSTGVAADRFGIHNTLILTRVFLVISFVVLVFTRSLWAFYAFAVVFSLPYGGEITQVPVLIANIFGTRAMATLVGLSFFAMSIGGAFGVWTGGAIYDATESYNWAFIAGALAGLVSLGMVLVLRKQSTGSDAA